jgi:hypothetical protein
MSQQPSTRLRYLETALLSLLVTGVFAPAALAEWDVYTPITPITVTNPGPNEVWLADMFNTLTMSTSTDQDRWRGSTSQPWTVYNDTVTQWWTGGGIFRNNNNIGTSVDYNSPWIDGTDTITANARDSGTMAIDPVVTVTRQVRTVQLVVHKVGFNVGYQLYQTPATLAGWDVGSTAIPMGEIYNADDAAAVQAAKNHFCTLRGTNNMVANIKCRTTVALTKTASFWLGAAGAVGGTWNWASCSIAAGQTESGACNPPKAGVFYGKVQSYTPAGYTIAWKYINTNFDNTQYDVNTTGHNCYLTYGAPDPGGTALTVQRVAFLVNSCWDADTDRLVSDGIWNAIGAPALPFGATATQTIQSDDWPLKSGAPYYGYCNQHANFMVRCLKLIGSTGTAYNTFASDGNGTITAPQSTLFQGNTWWLKFSFAANGVVDNNFEGSVSAGGVFYAITPKLTAVSRVNLLRQVGPDNVGAQQIWVQTADGTFWGATTVTGANIIPYPPRNP